MGNAGEAREVFVLDPDLQSGAMLARTLRDAGHQAVLFESERDLLGERDLSRAACLLIDDSLPILTGLQLQWLLNEAGCQAPVILLSASPTVENAVRALRGGALDFISKPVDPGLLLSAVGYAFALNRRNRENARRQENLTARFSELTERELEVLRSVIRGRLNKQTGADLGVTEKTVKVHRARMMQKLGVRTLPDLMHLTATAGLLSPSRKPGTLVTWDWDIVNDCLTGNRALRSLYNVRHASGAPLRFFIEQTHPHDIQRLGLTIRESIATRQQYQSRHRTLGDSGEPRLVLAYGRTAYDAGGQAIRFSGVALEREMFRDPHVAGREEFVRALAD